MTVNYKVNGATRFQVGLCNFLSGSSAGGNLSGTSGTILTTSTNEGTYSTTALRGYAGANYIEFRTVQGLIGTSYFVSDERKKENIQPTEEDSLEFIRGLDFIEFDWKPEIKDESHFKVGVSAQSVQELDPESIIELEDGYLQIFEPVFIVHSAHALKQLNQQLDLLTEEFAVKKQEAIETRNRLKELRGQLAKLKEENPA